MKIPPFEMSTEEIRAELAPLRADMSIAVVRAKNPFNVGAIIRVAHSFLVREIFLIGVEPYYERAAMGMRKYETIVDCPSEEDFLERVKGRPLVAVERDQSTTSIWEAEMPEHLVFVLGSENDGVPESILKAASSIVSIPMYGINHSFPVSIASGMVLAEWARRRDPRGKLTPVAERPPLR